MEAMQYVLLNPGPACVSDAVKKAVLDIGDVCPREEETGELMADVSQKITNLLTSKPKDYSTVLFTSSGTGAVESVISSLPEDAKVLNIVNGSYGKRISDMLKVYGIEHDSIDFQEDVLDINRIEMILSNFTYTHISVIHCETTTGVINDIDAIGKLCKRFDIKLIVDAMSSAFAYPIDCNKQNIDFLLCSSNKLVQGLPGIAMVVGRISEIEKCHSRTVYLDLKAQYETFNKTNQMRFTPAVQILSSLEVAVDELIKEGISNRYDRIKNLNDTIRNKMESLGFKALIDRSDSSIVITSYLLDGMNFENFHTYLKREGFVIYPGKVSNADTFRLSNIGDITEFDIKVFLYKVEEYMSFETNDNK